MPMKPEAQARRVRRAAHSKLWLGVDLSNAPHVGASRGARKMIAQDTLRRSYEVACNITSPILLVGDPDVR
jgi:hypothetical protein